MKRCVALLIGALVLMNCIFSGCGKQTVEKSTNPVNETVEGTADGSALSVYMVKTDALYVDAIDSFKKQAQDITLDVTAFQSYEAMLDVMNEDLMSEDGPDVVLYNSNSMQGEVDAYRLAKSGMFLPLDSFLEQLDPTIYPAALMNAGNIAGKQYFIPFSYNLIYAYTSQRLMTIKGFSPSDNLYEMIFGESEALMDVSHKSPTSIRILRPDPVNAFLDAAGIKLFDKNTGEVMVDKRELEEICRFVKLVYDNAEKNAELTNKFLNIDDNNFAGAANSFSFFTEDYAFMNSVRFYQSKFLYATDSPMVAMPYHKLDNTQELCASIVCFGGVNANTKTPEKAYGLLKYILDYNTLNSWFRDQKTFEYHAPVSLTVFQKAIDELSSNPGNGSATITPLSKENAAHLTETSQKITDAVIPNTSLGISLQETLEPYFMGKDSFENCYNTLLNKLQIYLSE